jgi:hypothetical protein
LGAVVVKMVAAMTTALWAVSLALLPTAARAQAQSFQAEGSDTGAGLGPRYVAMGGTGAAFANDAYALYYNPAGLAEVQGFELAVSRQLNATLHRINFLGAAWRLPLPSSSGLKATVAAAYYPRIHARASGSFNENDFESLFLRYLLPGISGTFDGDIDTKTKSYRVAFGIAPAAGSAWSAGAYVEKIDCRSTFCGVHATSNGFTTQSTSATATGVGVGVRYAASPTWTVAASVSDVRTRLTIDSVTTDAAGTRVQLSAAEFPMRVAVGAAGRLPAGWLVAIDYEATRGRYGKSEIDLQALRLGVERPSGAWAWRAGAVVPTKITSTLTGELKTPFPFAPTFGLGWRSGAVRVDLALYAHAVMSMHKDKPSPAADLGVALSF